MILCCKDDREQRMGFMPRPVLLLRRIELCEMDENNSYYIVTDKLQGVFTVRTDARTGLLRLESVWDTYIAEIHANDIRGEGGVFPGFACFQNYSYLAESYLKCGI